jgi:penicillin G amidase
VIEDDTLASWIVPQVNLHHFKDYNVSILSDEDLKIIGKYKPYDLPNLDESEFWKPNKDWYKKQEEREVVQDESISENKFGASNNWVIHGNHTASGKPFMAGDPHLGNQLPSFWTISALHIKNTEYEYMIGAYAPGCPFTVLGSNKHLQSASTTNCADSTDVYEEKVEGDKYLFNNEWRPLEIRKEYLKAKGVEKPFEQIIWYTHRGPLLDYFTDQVS